MLTFVGDCWPTEFALDSSPATSVFASDWPSPRSNQDVVETFLSQASVASDVSRRRENGFRCGWDIAMNCRSDSRSPAAMSHWCELTEKRSAERSATHSTFLPITPTQASEVKQVRSDVSDPRSNLAMRGKSGSAATRRCGSTRVETCGRSPNLTSTVTANERDTLVICGHTPVTGLAKHMLMGTGSNQRPRTSGRSDRAGRASALGSRQAVAIEFDGLSSATDRTSTSIAGCDDSAGQSDAIRRARIAATAAQRRLG